MDGATIGTAVDAYLATLGEPATVRAYRGTLRPLVGHFGAEVPVSQIESSQLASWAQAQWSDAKASTWNTYRGTVRRFFEYCGERGWSDPGVGALIDGRSPRRYPADPRFAARVASVIADSRFGLRERALWGVAFDSAAKAWEILALDVPDLDLAGRHARLPSSGLVSWKPSTNFLLLSLLAGRESGPVFLTYARAHPARAGSARGPGSGESRLSYWQAQLILAEATAGGRDGSLTFRQLREGSPIRHGWTPPEPLADPAISGGALALRACGDDGRGRPSR